MVSGFTWGFEASGGAPVRVSPEFIRVLTQMPLLILTSQLLQTSPDRVQIAQGAIHPVGGGEGREAICTEHTEGSSAEPFEPSLLTSDGSGCVDSSISVRMVTSPSGAAGHPLGGRGGSDPAGWGLSRPGPRRECQ